MTYVNSAADLFVGTLLRQFQSPWLGLVAVALATSFVMLLIIRRVSSPAAIRRAKDRLIARVLELVVFRHEAWLSFTAGGRILTANLAYLRTLLWPVLVSAIPCTLVLTQLSCWYAWRPLKVDEPAVVEVRLRDGFPVLEQPVSLIVPTFIPLQTEGVRVQSTAEIAWRLCATHAGSDLLGVDVFGEDLVLKQIVVGDDLQKVSARRSRRGLWDALLYPAERPIDQASSVIEIEVKYPPRILYLGNTEVDWVLAFFILTIIFGLLLKRPLRVQI